MKKILFCTHAALIPHWLFCSVANFPLHRAVWENNLKQAQALVALNPSIVHAIDVRERTPLHIAAHKGHDTLVQMLVKQGANVNACDYYHQTPLYNAVKKGHLYTARFLIKKNADVNIADEEATTPLQRSVYSGYLKMIRLLLNAKAAVNTINCFVETPLDAAYYKYPEAIDLLKDAEADARDESCIKKIPLEILIKNAHYPLHRFIWKNNILCAHALIESNPSMVNDKDNRNRTPLHIAARKGLEPLVRMLIEQGHTDVNVVDDKNQTPLFNAVKKGYLHATRFLIEKGADVNIADKNGIAPLSALSSDNFDYFIMLKLLLKTNADINSKNSDGATQLHVAICDNNQEALNLLLQTGADVNSKNNKLQTPLHLALSLDCPATIIALLKMPAIDVFAKDIHGNTPLTFFGRWRFYDKKSSFFKEMIQYAMKQCLNKARFTFLLCMRHKDEKPFELIKNNLFLLQKICSHLTVGTFKIDKELIKKYDSMYEQWLVRKDALSAAQQKHSKPPSALQ